MVAQDRPLPLTGCIAMLLAALCLATFCPPALAADNETEMVGDYVPVKLYGEEDGGEVVEAPEGEPADAAVSDDATATQESADDTSSETELQVDPSVGIPLSGGSVLQVDDHGRLTITDKVGTTTVFDDSQRYVQEVSEDGTAIIRSETGSPVEVSGGATVTFTNGKKEQVRVDITPSGTTVTKGDEPKAGSAASTKTKPGGIDEQDETKQEGENKPAATTAMVEDVPAEKPSLVLPALAGALFLCAAIGFVVWKRKRR